jgi:hypothetical protein
LLRNNQANDNNSSTAIESFFNYLIGGIYYFDSTFYDFSTYDLKPALNIFGGLTSFLDKVNPSNTTVFTPSINLGRFYITNINTLFGQLVYDFNIFLGPIFIFIVGIISNHFYNNIFKRKSFFFSLSVIPFFFFFFFHGLFSSPYNYFSLITPFLGFYIILKVSLNPKNLYERKI